MRDEAPIGECVLSAEQIRSGVAKVAALLNDAYDEAVVVTVVPGGILFTADLVRQLEFELSMDDISCPHTPGERHNQSPIVYHRNIDITGRDVILIDDAIEPGGTMKRLVEHLSSEHSPKSVAIATLFVKPGRVDIPVQQFFGYEMDNDDMLVGFGLPWNDRYRNLPYVATVLPAE